MRLIRADNLMERFRIVAQSGGPVVYHVSDICATIEDEATEEPVDAVEVVHGRWEHYRTGCYFNVKCTACGVNAISVNTTFFGYLPTVSWNYCPNCGAKMDKGE